MSEALSRFREKWLPRLNDGAATVLLHAEGEGALTPHTTIADNFVGEFGYRRIGFNWELLDAAPSAEGRRAAETQLVEAFSRRIDNPGQEWMPMSEARECARDFLALFAPGERIVVSNRYDGLWNPISQAANEWAFFGFDFRLAVLLLIAEG